MRPVFTAVIGLGPVVQPSGAGGPDVARRPGEAGQVLVEQEHRPAAVAARAELGRDEQVVEQFQVADLLDTKNGDDYVYAGQDSGNPPIPTPDAILSSNFYSQINDAVSTLSSNGSTATAQATRAIAASNAAGTSPFSAYLSQPSSALSVPVVQTGDGTTVPIGLLASSNSGAVSNGASTANP